MTRRGDKVVLLHREAYSMVDHWIDHIELRRNAYATFAVWGNKHGEDPTTGRRRWFDWEKSKGLKSPMEIHKAIEDIVDAVAQAFGDRGADMSVIEQYRPGRPTGG